MVNNNQKSKLLLLHRIIMKITNPKIIIDHENFNTLDNRKKNLRIIPCSNNSQHRKSKNSNNKSGYRNVSWNKSINKWVVQLQINGKNTILGKFDDVEEANLFAIEMRKKYYKE